MTTEDKFHYERLVIPYDLMGEEDQATYNQGWHSRNEEVSQLQWDYNSAYAEVIRLTAKINKLEGRNGCRFCESNDPRCQCWNDE